MKMIGSIRVNIVGHNDPMLSIADMDNNVAIELFGPEIEELREWLNSQISPTEAESYFKLGPEEWAEIRGEPFEDEVADEMNPTRYPYQEG